MVSGLIRGVILPEGVSVSGQTLDPRLISSIRLIEGSLPAEPLNSARDEKSHCSKLDIPYTLYCKNYIAKITAPPGGSIT
jgi:hypothetical protein